MNLLEQILPGPLHLRRGSALRIQNGAGLVVELLSGEAWLTQERDPRDYYLHAGDWLRLDRDGTAVVSATNADAYINLTALRSDSCVARVVLSGLGSKGPLQIFPASRPELVARLLATLGLSQPVKNAAASRQWS